MIGALLVAGGLAMSDAPPSAPRPWRVTDAVYLNLPSISGRLLTRDLGQSWTLEIPRDVHRATAAIDRKTPVHVACQNGACAFPGGDFTAELERGSFLSVTTDKGIQEHVPIVGLKDAFREMSRQG